ncbi:MAG: protease pro-enzyme activation domain-containing protein [Candidatus Sulfotelmatobacter sp.]
MRCSLVRSLKLFLPLLASTLCFAQQADRIAGPIDSSQMVTLPGHADRLAQPQYDQGPVEPSFQFGRVTLVMAPSPSQQVALDLLLAQQQDRSSPNYHKWLTPEQFADRFGVSQGDIKKITAWLEGQGFQVFSVPRGRTSVSFSGTAAQIQSSFKTEIHRYDVNGRQHIANSTPVEVPAALSGVVTGVRGLTDYHPKPMYVRPVHGGKNGPHPGYTSGEGAGYVLAPGDIATIYDLNTLYNSSPAIDGTGQKLAIIGETDIYLADIADFRSHFGLNPITDCSTDANGIVTATSCNTTNFQYVLVGADLGAPSTCGDLPEADLDIEWSGATARNAQIIFVNAPATFNAQCTEITNGGGTDVSLAYAIDNVVAPVISMSYGLCEVEATSLETELKQGNAEGITIMNSSGDSGAAACDDGPSTNTLPYPAADGGLIVNYPASSPEVTGVGGTSIPYPTFYNSSYWNSNNTSTVNFGGSALTSLEGQEAAWNDTAAFAQLCQEGDLNPQFCSQGGSPAVAHWVDITSAATAQEDLWVSAGGGGVSNCVNETGDICEAGFPRPSWQAVTIPSQGSPQKTYRLVPDVSLLASPDFPGYIFCTPLDQWTSSSSTASTCAGSISTAIDSYSSIVGGTSASSPVFAGIVTLLNQYLGSAGLGNINPTLYSLAATPGNGAFHHITSGDNDVYCQAGTPSGQPTDVICPAGGVFGFDASNADSTTGYNLVGGLGSVDGDSLAVAWAASRNTGSSITITSVSATNVTVGTSVSFAVSVTPTSGVGSVRFSTLNNGITTVLGSATLDVPYPSTTTGTTTFATTKLPGGTNSVTATYTGDASVGASTSAPTTVTVTVPFTMSASALSPASVPAGQTSISTVTITPNNGFTGTVSFTNSTASNPGSCTAGLPAGALCSFSPGSVTLSGSGSQQATLTITTVANMALPSGASAITVTGTSGSTAIAATVNLTVTATNQSFALTTTAATFSVTVGGTAPVNLTVTGTGTPISFVTNNVTALPLTYSCSGTPSLATAEISCQWSPSNGQSVTAAGVTLNLVTTAPTSGQLRPPLERGSRIFYAMLLPGLFGIVFAAGSRTRGLRLLSLIVVLGFSTLWLGSCGGSGGGGTTTPPNAGTPPGSYTVTINATTGGTNPVPLTSNGSPLTITLNVSH